MSVVNRMLLDIDRRHGAADIKSQGPYPDIRSVPSQAPPVPARKGVATLGVAVALAVAVGVAAWAGWFERAPAPVVKPAVRVAVAAPAAAPATPVAEPPSTEASVPAMPTPPAAVPAAPVVAPQEAEPPKRAPRLRERTAIEPFRLSRELSPVEERPVPSVRIATAPASAPKATSSQRQVAGDETVAVARALWNGGARAEAFATLREALAVAEGARNAAAVAPIARELARLEVADNRPQAALDLLRRLEGTLAEDAEGWALRGNAEQRLALHGDSARSYLAALRMRPAESRWMLGAAISLAAEGKVDEAQAWAERARERGAMSPAIATYLQQLGVEVRR